jgi:hypothetical protein
MQNVIFDGKWTFTREWKESSLVSSSNMYIRTAHWENYVYVMIDAVGLTQIHKNGDRAMVCFDGNDNKSAIADADDYCFVVTLGEKLPFVLQGGSVFGSNSYFKKISNPDGFIAVGGVSDENDRYTTTPHQSYEFRIPTDLIGRSDKYGFYVSVFDSQSNSIYSWPDNIVRDSPLKIPSPKDWVEIVSPDKSLPEFQYPMLMLIPAFLLVFYFTKFRIKF